jgi:hypothetical protein
MHHPVAAASLRFVQRDIRRLQDINSSLRVGGTFCNPKTRGDIAAVRNLNLLDGIPQSFGNFVATLFTRLNKQHGKLFAADSGSQIDASRAFSQNPADATYRLVTRVVTKAIVEILKPVDIDH